MIILYFLDFVSCENPNQLSLNNFFLQVLDQNILLFSMLTSQTLSSIYFMLVIKKEEQVV